MECDNSGPAPGWWALTGTPGCGKSSVARALSPRFLAVEVAELAGLGGPIASGAGSVEVDLGLLSRFIRRRAPSVPVVVAGHLSHLLPIRRVIVLRCHPTVLADRLERARRGTSRDRRENVEAEALDVISGEALGNRRTVWEIDTTHRGVDSVGRKVQNLLASGTGASDHVDWLSDPRVPALLLRGTG